MFSKIKEFLNDLYGLSKVTMIKASPMIKRRKNFAPFFGIRSGKVNNYGKFTNPTSS